MLTCTEPYSTSVCYSVLTQNISNTDLMIRTFIISDSEVSTSSEEYTSREHVTRLTAEEQRSTIISIRGVYVRPVT